jgi:lipid-A-disaccharide synthase
VLSYIASDLDYFIASKLVKLDYIGLSNIMFTKFNDKALHPEFIQKDVTAENLIKAFKDYDRNLFLKNSKSLRAYLKNGSSKTVASMIKGKK